MAEYVQVFAATCISPKKRKEENNFLHIGGTAPSSEKKKYKITN
jgi:hypothetical protein